MPEKNLLHCPKCNNEFPSQGRGRYVQIVDVIRNNQECVYFILMDLSYDPPRPKAIKRIKRVLKKMHKSDRDAILQEGGILTPDQIELLKEQNND